MSGDQVLQKAFDAITGRLKVDASPGELQEFRVLARGVRMATFTGDAFENPRHRGLRLYLNVYAAPAGTGPTLDVKLQTQDAESLAWGDMANAAFPQITAAGLFMLVIYPGINQAVVGTAARVSNMMSRRWRLVHTIGGVTPSFEYSVGGLYLP